MTIGDHVPHEPEQTSPPEAKAATYFTLARVTQRYLMLIGVFVGLTLATIVLTVAGFFVVLKITHDNDAQSSKMCQGFEDVTEKALTPYKSLPGATPEQRAATVFVNKQKAARIAALKPELLDHAGCHVSVNG